jgi:hypothetical protein
MAKDQAKVVMSKDGRIPVPADTFFVGKLVDDLVKVLKQIPKK